MVTGQRLKEVTFIWNDISDVMEAYGGREKLLEWFKEGADDPEEGSVFVFFDGDDRLAGFEPGNDEVELYGNSLHIVVSYYCENGEEIKPEISVAEVNGWDLPDDIIIK